MAFKDIDFSSSGVPVVKIAEVKNGVSGQTKFTGETYNPKYLLHDGDMLFCWSGQPETSIDTYWWRGGDGWLNQHIFKVSPISEFVDVGFFFQLLRYLRPTFVQIARDKQTTGLGHVTKRDLERLEVGLPPFDEQREIAATLGSIDDKIDSNRRLIALIPELIRCKVRESLLGESLEVPVASLARFVNGGAYTKGASGTGRMVLRIAELNSGPGRSTVYNDIEVPEDKLARPGDILMSWSGSLGVYRWYLDEAIINQHIFKVIPVGYPAWLVADRLEAVVGVFQGIARDKATTMGHIKRGHLESTLLEVPMPDAIALLDTELSSLWDRLLLAERENIRLGALRDKLSPELLSGRIQTRSISMPARNNR
jgi:type I restriction enzyme S subunit